VKSAEIFSMCLSKGVPYSIADKLWRDTIDMNLILLFHFFILQTAIAKATLI